MKAEKVTDEIIAKIERSAMLQLEEAERDQVRADLEQMLGYVNQLQQLNTEGVEPVLHPFNVTNAFREDQAVEQGLAEKLKNSAPKAQDGWYMVPRTISENDERQPKGDM